MGGVGEMEGARQVERLLPPLKGEGWRSVAEVVASSHLGPGIPQPGSSEEQPICWICLDTETSLQPLIQPCRCPRQAHPTCVARWQLQSAGTRKETHCEFCDEDLPDWKRTLTPHCGANAPAIMNVNFNDRTFSFEVKPGREGYKQFTEAIRHAFHLPEDSELNITFTCDEPVIPPLDSPMSTPEQIPPATPVASPSTPQTDHMITPPTTPTTPNSASLLTLQGAGAYDAAVHCASVSAAKRLQQHGSPSGSVSPEQLRAGAMGSPRVVQPRRQPYSTIPGYNRDMIEQNMQQIFHRDQRAAAPMPLDMARGISPHAIPHAMRGFPHLPPVDDPRLNSVSRRNSSSIFQRSFKAVRKSFTGKKSDRTDS